MTLHTLWDTIKERFTNTPAPKKTRRPRQPSGAVKSTRDTEKTISFALCNLADRVHQLEQIEHRRSEREKEMKTNG